ncbi:MAG: hypothetical protein KKH67_04955 [candidate division Zixibacteria bacterium]|nr:hypothetical protein [candidate division Zixibacteria bacterium]MBU1469605.1 hypothetical protein [candidate division Zixibacteria bacterium]
MKSKSNRNRTARIHRDKAIDEHDTDSPIAEEMPARIPAGTYEAGCCKVEIAKSFKGRRSLFIRFRIHGGDYSGTELPLICPYPNGKIRFRHKLYQQWCIAMGRPPTKGERISGKAFLGKLYRIRVRDTVKNSFGTPLPEYLRYSVVDSIEKTLVGGKCHA